MPNFYSPSGNLEVWDKKPIGYFEEGEWQARQIEPKEPIKISDLKVAKLQELKDIFESILEQGKGSLEIEGIGVVNAGKTHLSNVQNLIRSVEINGGSKDFRLYNNSFVSLGIDELAKIELALIDYGERSWAKKWAYEQAINAAKTASDLEAINIEF